MSKQRIFGIVGYPLSHTFSPGYFKEKFETEGIEDASYQVFEKADLHLFLSEAQQHEDLIGFNVTIPYKEGIIPLLHSISDEASFIGAVNTVKRVNGKLEGYNTDVFGFQKSLEPLLKQHHTDALILGTGGASKAVRYVLKQLGINYLFVSRSKDRGQITYDQLNENFMKNYPLIINTTPLGMKPDVDTAPQLPYQFVSENHLFYDLVYNPSVTKFLRLGQQQGATIKNGLEMLHLQAEKSWEIWN